MKIGSLKMCGGCKMVGYFGKDEQKKDWTNHKQICKAVTNLMKRFNVGHITEKVTSFQT